MLMLNHLTSLFLPLSFSAEDKDYFIDPNGGNAGDAFAVSCRSVETNVFTCIKPSNETVSSLEQVASREYKAELCKIVAQSETSFSFFLPAEFNELVYIRVQGLGHQADEQSGYCQHHGNTVHFHYLSVHHCRVERRGVCIREINNCSYGE